MTSSETIFDVRRVNGCPGTFAMKEARVAASRRVLVFAGGDFVAADLACAGDVSETTGIVCVDSGLLHCLDLGLMPTLLVGDMDSVTVEAIDDPALASVPRLLFPADKDASDLELALHALADGDADGIGIGDHGDGVVVDRGVEAERGGGVDGNGQWPDEVIVVGVSGGRTDHLLFNWLLAGSRDWPFELRLIDATVDAVVVTPSRPLYRTVRPGSTVSLLPHAQAVGVTTVGLRYGLADATLNAGGTLGLSNVVAESSVSVSIREGTLLALFVR